MMSGEQDCGERTYFKSELLCASSFIEDVIARWEKSAVHLSGADADLIELIRQKQQEWERAAGKCEYPPPPPTAAPSAAPQTPSAKVILGPRYATSEMLTDGGLSIEGPRYGQILKSGSKPGLGGDSSGAQFGSTERGQDGSSQGRGDVRGERGLSTPGNGQGQQGLSREVNATGEKDHYGAEDVPARPQASGRRERDYDSVHNKGSRSLCGLDQNGWRKEEGGGSENGSGNGNGGIDENGSQRERRRQRMERKRKKESGEGTGTDGLVGPRVDIGARSQTEGRTVGNPESDLGASHQHAKMHQESEEAAAAGKEVGGIWAGEGERKGSDTPAAHVTDDAMDYFSGPNLEPITHDSEADFPALGGGVAPPASAAPLKRFTALKRPGAGVALKRPWSGVDDVSVRSASWAKLIGSKASDRDSGGEATDVVRNDEAYQEYERKRAEFEEADRRKRRKMRSRDDYECLERLKGKMVNTVQGLVLHENVLDESEQSAVIRMIKELERLGLEGLLRGRTFTAPRKWMRGKGRVTIQFGCCYNYAVDRQGRPPGILQDEAVEPLPAFMEDIIDRMVRWKVMPGGKKRPDSAIVNLYSEGDCIPIHIDHHDFDRPFCTISLQSVAPIKFGAFMESLDAGQFSGAFELPLPTGSVCILNGNAADVAKHCIPSVPAPRISITFRRMRPEKSPYINTVLPMPDHGVFHSHAFSPSLIPPSLQPPRNEIFGSIAIPEASRSTPPLDVSAEIWPDLSGKPAGGPVEAGEKSRSGSPAWATNSATRPVLGEGVTERPSEPRQSARPLLPRPLLARGSEKPPGMDWPELGAGGKRRPLKRSSSVENPADDTERTEPLPPRLGSSARGDRPGKQGTEQGTEEERRRFGRPKSRDASPLGRSTLRPTSPAQTIGRPKSRDASPPQNLGRSTSRPASPAQAIGQSTSRPASPSVLPSETEGDTLKRDGRAARVSPAAGVPGIEPSNQSGLGGNQSLNAEPLKSGTALHAERDPDLLASADIEPALDGEPKPDPNPVPNPTLSVGLELADSDAQTPTAKASGLRERTEDSKSAEAQNGHGLGQDPKVEEVGGSAKGGQVSRSDWSGDITGRESPAEKGSRGGRGSPPGLKLPVHRERFGNGETGEGARGASATGARSSKNGTDERRETGRQPSREPSREPSPDSGDLDFNRFFDWRRERRMTEAQWGLSPGSQSDESGAIPYGKYDGSEGRVYGRGGQSNRSPASRSWSEERRISPELNQERNAIERNGPERNGPERNGPERNGTERNGTERNGMERTGTERNGTERNGTEQNSAQRNGTERNGTERTGAERNGWGQGGTFDQSGLAGGRFSGRGQNDNAYSGPTKSGGDWRSGSRGGLTLAAEGYRRGTAGQFASPGTGVQKGVSPAGYANPEMDPNQTLLATAPEFVPAPKFELSLHQESLFASMSNGAYSHLSGSNGSGDTSRPRGSDSVGYQNHSGSNGSDYGAGSHRSGSNGTGYGAYSHQSERDNRHASPHISPLAQEERQRDSPLMGRILTSSGEQAAAGSGSDKPHPRVARVDATCAFDRLSDGAGSRPLDARQDGASTAELPAAFTSPAAPFARFFPKETPKKTLQY